MLPIVFHALCAAALLSGEEIDFPPPVVPTWEATDEERALAEPTPLVGSGVPPTGWLRLVNPTDEALVPHVDSVVLHGDRFRLRVAVDVRRGGAWSPLERPSRWRTTRVVVPAGRTWDFVCRVPSGHEELRFGVLVSRAGAAEPTMLWSAPHRREGLLRPIDVEDGARPRIVSVGRTESYGREALALEVRNPTAEDVVLRAYDLGNPAEQIELGDGRSWTPRRGRPCGQGLGELVLPAARAMPFVTVPPEQDSPFVRIGVHIDGDLVWSDPIPWRPDDG